VVCRLHSIWYVAQFEGNIWDVGLSHGAGLHEIMLVTRYRRP
jgi:hypothetical protein